jgi:hypothetical protein
MARLAKHAENEKQGQRNHSRNDERTQTTQSVRKEEEHIDNIFVDARPGSVKGVLPERPSGRVRMCTELAGTRSASLSYYG